MVKHLTKTLLAALALAWALSLSSCVSESILPTPPNPSGYKTLSLHITQSSTTRGISPSLRGELVEFNTGDLYLVSAAGIVVEHFRITQSMSNGGTEPTDWVGGIINRDEFNFNNPADTHLLTLTNIPGHVTNVVIIGNTPHNAVHGYINAIGRRVLDIISQHNALTPGVNLFGTTGTLTHVSGDNWVGSMTLAPTVARFEIESITGTGRVAEFTLAGIFMDNFYSRAQIDGDIIPASLWTGGTNPNAFALGQHYFTAASNRALFDIPNRTGDTNNNRTIFPATLPGPSINAGYVWSYHVFAETGTQLPRIILRLRNVRLEGSDEVLEGYRFITIRQFYRDNALVANINPGEVYNMQVVFNEYDLDLIPNLPVPVPVANSRVTAFVSVLYDFQSQRFETFVTGGDVPASWQWQWSANNIDWTTIPDAVGTSFTTTNTGTNDVHRATWRLPADFMHNVATPNANGELYFRAVIIYPDGSYITQTTGNTLRIKFIQTTQAGGNSAFLPGFGICLITNTRYAIMGRAAQENPYWDSSEPFPTTGNTIRVALLNLGADDDNGGLGYLFQWGRQADGHQRIGWHNNVASPHNTTATTELSTDVNNNLTALGTSMHAPRQGPFDDSNTRWGQPANINERRFLTAAGDWSDNLVDLWGAGFRGAFTTREHLPIRSIGANAWTERANNNNPCPPGWRVPSRFDWLDMHSGDGNSSPDWILSFSWAEINAGGNHSGNTWTFHLAHTGTAGAATVRSTSGATIILPAAGLRNETGIPVLINSQAQYWSSTQHNEVAAMNVVFSFGGGAAEGHTLRAFGRSVRCVAD